MSHQWNSLEYRVCQLELKVEQLQSKIRSLEKDVELTPDPYNRYGEY